MAGNTMRLGISTPPSQIGENRPPARSDAGVARSLDTNRARQTGRLDRGPQLRSLVVGNRLQRGAQMLLVDPHQNRQRLLHPVVLVEQRVGVTGLGDWPDPVPREPRGTEVR